MAPKPQGGGSSQVKGCDWPLALSSLSCSSYCLPVRRMYRQYCTVGRVQQRSFLLKGHHASVASLHHRENGGPTFSLPTADQGLTKCKNATDAMRGLGAEPISAHSREAVGAKAKACESVRR